MARIVGTSSHILQQRVLRIALARSPADTGTTISGRSVASAMRLKCASAIAAFCPSVNGAGGNTSSAEAPPCVRHASPAGRPRALPSAQMPLTSGSLAPISSCAISSTRRCSSKVQEATSVECALMVMAERPSTAATSRRCLRKFGLVDRQIVLERQQHGRNDAVRDVIVCGLASVSSLFRGSHIASIAEFGRKAIGGSAHRARAFLQGLDRQPPDRPGNADGADDLPGKIAHRQRHAAQFGVEFAVVDG